MVRAVDTDLSWFPFHGDRGLDANMSSVLMDGIVFSWWKLISVTDERREVPQ